MTKLVKDFEKKFIPKKDKEYLLTDQCMWEMEAHNGYNPYDKKRKPHVLQLVDPVSGTIVNLKSGSLIKIIKAIV
jgi:hypothetical protein